MFDELKAKYRFWYASNFIELNKHYDFMFDASDANAMAVRFLKKYPGVIVEYSNIHMSTDTDLVYDFSIIANPNLCDTNSQAFKNFSADVFRSIINNSIKHAIKGPNENGNTDSLQSDSERAFHEEVSTVFEKRVPERKPRTKGIRRGKKIHPQVQQSASDSSTGDQP